MVRLHVSRSEERLVLKREDDSWRSLYLKHDLDVVTSEPLDPVHSDDEDEAEAQIDEANRDQLQWMALDAVMPKQGMQEPHSGCVISINSLTGLRQVHAILQKKSC